MCPNEQAGSPGRSKDFFISYTAADRAWAIWIAAQLETDGFSTVLQAWDFRPGGQFIQQMRQAYADSERMLAVISSRYFASKFAQSEWDAAFAEDPDGTKGKLVPVRVEDFQPPALDRNRVYIDLTGLEEEAARTALLAGVRRTRPEQIRPMAFPGTGKPAGGVTSFPGNRPAIWKVPPRNPNFTGRSTDLESLHSAFTASGNGSLVQVLHGLGGVGKSQMAAEYAHRFAADYDVVWWVPATMPVTTSTVVAALGEKLGVVEQRDLAETAGQVWDLLSERDRWLVVFDYAEHARDLEAYRPRGPAGHVLITSRSPGWGGVGHAVDVPLLPREDSVAFILRRLDQGLKAVDDEERLRVANELCEELGDLPLALEQAAAYVEHTGMSIADYVALFRRRRGDLLARGEPTGYEGRVDTTWQIAFNQVDKSSPAAAALLRLLSFLAPDPIPLDLLAADVEALPPELGEAVTGEIELQDAVGILNDYSLVDREGGAVLVHRLVQAVVREDCPAEERAAWAERVVRLLHAAFPANGHQPETWSRCAQLVSHVLVATAYVQASGVEPGLIAADLLRRAGVYLGSHVELGAAQSALERALEIVGRAAGPESPEAAQVLIVLGNIKREEGYLTEARELLERAVAIRETKLGKDSPALTEPLTGLAIVQRRQGFLAEARQTLERALAIQQVASDEQGVEVGALLMDLGVVLWDGADLEAARRNFEQALDIYRLRFDPAHPKLATALTYLGGVLRDLGDLQSAQTHLARALEIDEAAYGPDHPRVAARCNNLATALWRLGQLDPARQYLERALDINERSYGTDHPEVATVCNNMGIVLRRLGLGAQAKAHLGRALAIDERVFGPTHPRVGTRCSNLGDVLRDLDETPQAAANYSRARSIFEAAYGADHPTVAAIGRKLASVSPQGPGPDDGR